MLGNDFIQQPRSRVLYRHSQAGQQWQTLYKTILHERRKSFLVGTEDFNDTTISSMGTPLAGLVLVLPRRRLLYSDHEGSNVVRRRELCNQGVEATGALAVSTNTLRKPTKAGLS